MACFEVRSYSVNISNCSSPYAYIILFNGDTEQISHLRARLDFSFMEETNRYNYHEHGDTIQVPMHFRLFQSVVDILRNERPVYFNWMATTQTCLLSTREEPVGEGEMQAFYQRGRP
ncbi:MAG: hypothetical protein JW797_09825 [Bradymonadales bacterium]|nr:hypothetical protein [Bradymonadales bacterium]